MVEKWREILVRDVAVLIDRSDKYLSVMLIEPCWVVGATAKERYSVGRARDNHALLVDLPFLLAENDAYCIFYRWNDMVADLRAIFPMFRA